MDRFLDQLDEKNSAIAQEIVAALQAKDPGTCSHSEHVARLMGELAAALHFDKPVIMQAYLAGLVHDVGKITVPDSILNKPGKLTGAEFAIMKTHSEQGAVFLEKIPAFQVLGEIARHHHERFDGAGYPKQLSGEAIPFFSRMLTVCDSFEAMTGERSYKQPISQQEALGEIARGGGTQFDPYISRIFIACQEKSQF